MAFRPIRVLQVVPIMARAGVQTWLMQVLRRLDRREIEMDVLVDTFQPGDYDDEIRELGVRLLRCPTPTQPWRYAYNFLTLLKAHGPYDVVHCHLHHWCGFVLRLARWGGVPVRIAHSRSAQSFNEHRRSLAWAGYRGLMNHWIRRHATLRMAVSGPAAAGLFGAGWQERCVLLPSAIELEPFRAEVDPRQVRGELGLPDDALVIGHVGRFSPEKNHQRLLEVLSEGLRQDPRLFLLLVGQGPLRGAFEEQVDKLGLSERVRFLDNREDVPRLMRGAMDAIVFPSTYEGLPRVTLEAQAAGLPVVISDSITPELAVVPELVHWLSLSRPPGDWARATLDLLQSPPRISHAEALAKMEASPWNIETNVRQLSDAYRQALGRIPEESDRRRTQGCS